MANHAALMAQLMKVKRESSFGGSPQPSPSAMLTTARSLGAASAANWTSGGSEKAADDEPHGEPARARRLPQVESDELLLSDDVLSRAMCGDLFVPGSGTFVQHTAADCKRPRPDGAPCWSGLWKERAALRANRMRLLVEDGLPRPMKDRSVHTFHRLQSCATDDDDKDAWDFFANGRCVCRHTFLLDNPLSSSQVYALQRRHADGCRTAHNSTETESVLTESRLETKKLGIVGWYQGYAEGVGDHMPDEQETIVPRRPRNEEFAEYQAAFGPDAAVYDHFVKTVREDGRLGYIRRARKLANFQGCLKCNEENQAVKRCLAGGNREGANAAKRRRTAHIEDSRNERTCYYRRRELGRDTGHSSVSLILDKWDASKTTVPWFARAPGAAWKDIRNEVLEQHALGVLVHGRPNHTFLYVVNDTIKGNANLNIEGLRLTLAKLYADTPMPHTLYVQGDNASDNKCWAVILFLAMLVFYEYIGEAFLSFLLVGHTHEDIDQLFSVISRYFKSLGQIASPAEFDAAAKHAMRNLQADVSHIEAVLEWDKALLPCMVKPRPQGIQHASLPTGAAAAAAAPSTEMQAGPSTAAASEVREPHTFWIHRRSDGTVVLHYKERSTHAVWLPPVDPAAEPLVTSEDGIVLFASPPPDPMVNPPVCAPFAGPAGAQKVPTRTVDSSDEDEAPEPRDPMKFSKEQVYSAVSKLRDKFPSFLTEQHIDDWNQWRAATPEQLDQVTAANNPLPLKLPMKYKASPATGAPAAAPAATQVPLITFRNPEGQGVLAANRSQPQRCAASLTVLCVCSAVYSQADRSRDALVRRRLSRDDVPVGSCVALRRAAADPWMPEGYGTLFYLAEVLGIQSDDDGFVTSIQGHFRLPMGKAIACNDETKSWKPGCCGLHNWSAMCETHNKCVQRRAEGMTTSKLLVDIEPEMVFETGITFTAGDKLEKAAKRRLAQSAPTSDAWHDRLGLRAEKSGAKLPAKKQRVKAR